MKITNSKFSVTALRIREGAKILSFFAAFAAFWIAGAACRYAPAAAYVYTPTDSAADLWSLGTNWNPTPLPNTAPKTELAFVGDNATILSDNLNNTNTNDLPAALQLNILDLRGTGPAHGPATINIAGTANAGLYFPYTSSYPNINLDANAGAGGLTYNVGLNMNVNTSNRWLNFQGDGTAAFNFSGSISGNIGLDKNGSSTLTLSGASTYGGTTDIYAGTLRLSGGTDRLPTTTSVYLQNTAGATFDLNGQNQTVTALTGGGTAGGNVALGSGTLTINSSVGHSVYSGTISGDGNLVKEGTAVLSIFGAQSYTGTTTINGGLLKLYGSNGCLPATTAVSLANKSGATLAISIGIPKQTIGSLSGGGALGGNVDLGACTLTLGDSSDAAYAGVISNGNGLVKQGTGTQTLSGQNIYWGPTTINAGTLRIADNYSLPGNTSVTLANAAGATLDLNGKNLSVAALNGGGTKGGNVTLGSGTLNIGNAFLSESNYAGVISGTGSIACRVPHVTLSGNNTYTGSTTIENGTLALGVDNALPTGSLIRLGGILATNGFSQTDTLGPLKLSLSSFIDMGSSDESILKFADSAGQPWTGPAGVVVKNWNGSFAGGGGDELFFGTSAASLTAGQLGRIYFSYPNGLSGNYAARILPTGEVVPVPEPTMLALLIGGGLLLGCFALRRRR